MRGIHYAICPYQPQYQQQTIDLILHIQNDEAKIALPLEEQPDLLDTPAVAVASHRFYERAGFVRITKEQLPFPFPYQYPERDSWLYLLVL